MFIQVTGVVPVCLVSDLSRIFLFKLTFKKGGKSHSNKRCFNNDKALPVNKARKAAPEPTLAALPSLTESIRTVLACVSFPNLLGFAFAVPVGRSCCPGWAGLGWAHSGSAAPRKGSWVQLSPSQLLAAGGTHSISSLLQLKWSLKSPLKRIWVWQAVECSTYFENVLDNFGKCFTVCSGQVKFTPSFHVPWFSASALPQLTPHPWQLSHRDIFKQ